jgi:hypothetical protein
MSETRFPPHPKASKEIGVRPKQGGNRCPLTMASIAMTTARSNSWAGRT